MLKLLVRKTMAAIKFEITQAKSYVLRRVLVELPRPSALRKRLMHFPFEIIIWDTKVF
jgi:hypothetical protein